MYLLWISVFSNGKEFTALCKSNLVRVLNEAVDSSNVTHQPNYEFVFRVVNSSVFTTDEQKNIEATIYNCLNDYNISASNLQLKIKPAISSRRRRSDPNSLITLATLIVSLYSLDTSPAFISYLTQVLSLNISNGLIFVSATINNHTYGILVSENSPASVSIQWLYLLYIGLSYF